MPFFTMKSNQMQKLIRLKPENSLQKFRKTEIVSFFLLPKRKNKLIIKQLQGNRYGFPFFILPAIIITS